ncbi:MAG: caspase family protein [Nitratireductor sp.]|nr:caspase family protein [Nitratireductor sp.]
MSFPAFRGVVLVFALLAAISPRAALAAGGRVALVIGNGAYTQAPALANPANDAELLTASLKHIGFDVVSATDASRRSLLDAVAEFGRRAQNAEIALFFYAGHGLEVGGRNWILPVDANVEASTDLPVAAVKVDDVLEVMELSGARVRLVFLDACRNNPLPRSLSRAVGRGLARIDVSAAGTMIAFSAAPGTVALDGAGRNSPFSTALAKHIVEPGVEMRQMMARVRADVVTSTGEKQVPWVNEAVVGEYFLAGTSGGEETTPAPSGGAPAASGRSDDIAVELAFWDSVKDSKDKTMLELYVQKYPQGSFRDIAEAKIAMLDRPSSDRSPTPQINTQSGNTSGSQPDAQAQLENAARQFVAGFNAAFSAPADQAVASVYNIYAAQVDFYGKTFSVADIARDKAGLIARWPQRSYRSPENEMSIFCNPVANSCNVSTRVYWSVSSAARGKTAGGISQTDLKLDFSSGAPRVVYENSQTLSRN